MYQKFIDACLAGNLAEVQKIYEECAQDKRQEMLQAKNIHGFDYAAFRSATYNGHLDVVIFLWEKCDKNKRQEMLASESYCAHCLAAENGHLDVVKFLWENCQEDKRQEMISSGDYNALVSATFNGHLDVVKFLWEKCQEDKRQEMLASCKYFAFRSAAMNGHFHVLDWLLSVAEEKMRTEIYPKLNEPEFSQKLVLQREEIIKKEPELDIDKFNSQLTRFCKNPTLSRVLLTCKNLPEGLGHSLQLIEIFAKTANSVVGKKHFDLSISEPIKAAQAAIHDKLGKAVNTPEFFLAARKLKFSLSDFEDKADSHIHSGEGCSIL